MSLKNFNKTSGSTNQVTFAGSLLSAARRKVVHLPCWVSISEFQAARGKLGFGKMEKSWISTVLAEDIYIWKNIPCVYFFENTRAWNRMQEMEMVQRPYMIFIAVGIRVGSCYLKLRWGPRYVLRNGFPL